MDLCLLEFESEMNDKVACLFALVLAEWTRARVEGWVVAFPLAECRADDQKVGSVIHQFARMRVDGHEDVYYFGWMKGH